MNGATRHVYQTTGEHLTEGFDCWCSPSYNLPCNECHVELAPANDVLERIYERGSGCWKCTDGLVRLTRAEAEAESDPLVIVHNR